MSARGKTTVSRQFALFAERALVFGGLPTLASELQAACQDVLNEAGVTANCDRWR